MSIVQKVAVVGLTGIIGLGLGLGIGVTGANAAAHHNQDKSSSKSAAQHGQQKQGQQKQSDGQGRNKAVSKVQHDKVTQTRDAQPSQRKSGGTAPQNDTPDAIPAPTK